MPGGHARFRCMRKCNEPQLKTGDRVLKDVEQLLQSFSGQILIIKWTFSFLLKAK